MNIYRIISDAKLHSFNDPIGEVPILDSRLYDIQNDIIYKLGYRVSDISEIESIPDKEYIVFREDLFFTTNFFEKIVSAAKNTSSSLQFTLGMNSFNQRFVLPFRKEEGFLFDIKYMNGAEIEQHEIAQKIYEFDVRLPDQIVKGGNFPMPQCDCFAAHIISPFHLLQVNMALNLNRSISLQKSSFKAKFKNLKGRLGSFLFYRGLKSLNKIGKNCFIHPSAIIEGSIIGDNVKIGANAIVRLSHVGNDCTISDNVVVANSVLGDKTYISNSNFIELCQTYEEAFLIHGPYQFSIFGRNSACFATINCDIRLDQKNIVIPTSVGHLDSNQPLLGIAYGHHTKTGGGNIIAAGRIVPNNRHINPPDSIILKFDK